MGDPLRESVRTADRKAKQVEIERLHAKVPTIPHSPHPRPFTPLSLSLSLSFFIRCERYKLFFPRDLITDTLHLTMM